MKKKLVFPREFKDNIRKEIESSLKSVISKEIENTNSRLDTSFESILEKTQSLIDSQKPKFDFEAAIENLKTQIASLEKKKGFDKLDEENIVKKILSQIKTPLDGKPGPDYILNEQDKLDIIEPIEKSIFEKTNDLISGKISEKGVLGLIGDLIKRLKNGDIKIKDKFGGANGPEIIKKINKTLGTDWQLNFSFFNIEEDKEITIPANQQMTVHGDLFLDGDLISEGNLIIEL